jgi:uncharacterized protein YoxC
LIPAEILASPRIFPPLLALQTGGDWRGWVDVLADLATIVIALALIAAGVGAIAGLVALRRAKRRATASLERLRVDLRPIIQSGTVVAENVSHVSTAVRSDVERLQRTIADADRRVNRITELAEARVSELSALLEVVQEEAEDLFFDAASTVRGLHAGTEALRGSAGADEGYDEAGPGYEGSDESVLNR